YGAKDRAISAIGQAILGTSNRAPATDRRDPHRMASSPANCRPPSSTAEPTRSGPFGKLREGSSLRSEYSGGGVLLPERPDRRRRSNYAANSLLIAFDDVEFGLGVEEVGFGGREGEPDAVADGGGFGAGDAGDGGLAVDAGIDEDFVAEVFD